MLIKLLDKLIDFLYNCVLKLNATDLSSKIITITVSPRSLFPYDLVASKDDYEKLMLNGYKIEEATVPVIGVVLGMEEYQEEEDGLIPTRVKVFYYNLKDFKHPIVKIIESSELKLLSSPIKDLIQYSSFMSEVEKIMEDISGFEDIPSSDDDDGGEIVQ